MKSFWDKKKKAIYLMAETVVEGNPFSGDTEITWKR